MANEVDIYSVLEGLEPTPEEVKEAEAFAQQYLKTQFPDMDLRIGTGVRDLVIRPTASLLALLNKGLDQYFKTNTLEGVDENSSQDRVNAILSNFFLERKQGSRSIINVRLYFAIAKTVSLPASASFSPDDVFTFYPQESQVITKSQLTFDPNTDDYYFDVNMISEGSSEEYNIETGSMLYFSTFDTYFIRAEINYLVTPAVPPETNLQLLDRAPSAISTRNLINRPSIKSNLTDAFPSLKTVLDVGYGDSDMIRDQVTIVDPITNKPGKIHVGGKVDVYCKTPLSTDVTQYTLDGNGELTFSGPVFEYSRSLFSVGTDDDTLPKAAWPPVQSADGYDSSWNLVDPQKDFGFSSRQQMTLSFGPQYANRTVSIIVSKFTLLSSLQAYLESPDNRVLCGDYLARAFNFYWLDIEAVSYSSSVITSSDLKPVVNEYLENLNPGEAFVMSDLLRDLSEAGFPTIKTPLNVSYKYLRRDFQTTVGTIPDYLDPPDKTAIFILKNLKVSYE